MAPSTILLRGGVALLHDKDEHVRHEAVDILIEGNNIAQVGPSIDAPANAQIIDCSAKIISPGFISTHNHMWQTQLKGRHANHTLYDYMTSGLVQSSHYTNADIVWGQLSGCLEAIDNGTTTVLDHSHVNTHPGAAKYAISATVSSGVRSVYAYTPTVRLIPEPPYVANPTILEDWTLPTLEALAAKAPFGPNGRVRLGLGFDGFFLPQEMLKPFFDRVDPLKLALVTSHDPHKAFWGRSNGELAANHGQLENLVLSHSNSITPEQAKEFAKHNAYISATPSSELQMAFGYPLALNERYAHIKRQVSLGIDCHSNNPCSIINEMRLLLQSARARRSQEFLDKDQVPRNVYYTTEDAFNLGTLAGARAVKMEGKLGTIAPGAVADLVLFDALSPGLVGAAQHDPLSAIVLHSSPADISDVMVDGVFRKRDGKLLPVTADGAEAAEVLGHGPVDWAAVARAVVSSRTRIQGQIDKVNTEEVFPQWLKIWGIDPANFVDDKD